MTNPIRILHLSDIHFSSVVNNHQRVEHNDVRERLLECAGNLKDLHGSIHGIVIAGDIAFSGTPAEYVQAADWIERLSARIGCPHTSVFPVPGNHDVNLARTTSVTKGMHRYYRGLPILQLRREIEDLGKGPTEHFLIEKLRDYHEFASLYGCDFVSPSRPMWGRRLPVDARRTLRLVGLTSVQVSDLDDTKGGLILGANQYILDEEDCVEQIVVTHHPLDWLKDQRDAESYIHNRARLIITGHEHFARVAKTTEADCDRLIIESGAVTPPDDDPAGYIYHFNLLCLTLKGDAGQETLKVQVYPQVWAPQRTRFVPDSARLGGAESAEFVLRCPRFRRPACSEAVDPTVQHPEALDDDGIAKLRYLIWRHLDWKQRMGVLVRVNALPDSPGDAQPHGIERSALVKARELGRLKELWDLVDEFVPAGKRTPNPFT